MTERFHGGIQSEAQLQERWNVIRPALGDLRDKRVLDVGAAEGWFTARCKEAGADVVAVEPVRAFAVPNVLRIMQPFDSPAFWDDVLGLPGAFDFVLMLRVLYHMKIPQLALARAASLLREGGVLILENWFEDPSRGTLELEYFEDNPDGWRFVPTAPALRAMLRQYGFDKPEVLHTYQGGCRQIWRTTKL